MTADEMWERFCALTGRSVEPGYCTAYHFELTQKASDALLGLVLEGRKQATSSSLDEYREGRLPRVGDYNIVTDWTGDARCVICTIDVRVLPFRDVTFDLCRYEGEDDTLASWQESHRRFFTEDGLELGYRFTEDMPIVFERFRLVYDGTKVFPDNGE